MLLHIKKNYFSHFCCLFLKSSKTFSVSLILIKLSLIRFAKSMSLCTHKMKIAFESESTKQALEILFSGKKVSTSHPCISFRNVLVIKGHALKHLRLFLGSCLHAVHSTQS